MKHLFRNFKGHIGAIILILAIIVLQAVFDLSLPNYTSSLIDVGISGRGLEYVTPVKLTEESYQSIKFYMTDEEAEALEEAYVLEDGVYSLISTDAKGMQAYDEVFTTPIVINYLVSQMDEETQKELMGQGLGGEDVMTGATEEIPEGAGDVMTGATEEIPEGMNPAMMDPNFDMEAYMLEQQAIMMEQLHNQVIEMRGDIEEKLADLGDTMLHNFGLAFTKAEAELTGVSLDDVQKSYLINTGVKMLLMGLGMLACALVVGIIASVVGAKIGRDLRSRIFKKVLEFSEGEMQVFSTASLITRSTNDIQQVQFVTVMILRVLLYSPILAIGGIIMLVRTGAGMYWILVLAIVAIVCVVVVLLAIAMPKFKILQELVDGVNRVSREILTGLLVIRAFSREKHAEIGFDIENQNLTKVNLFVNRLMSIMMPIMMLIMYAVSILIVWVGAGEIDNGNLEVGSLTAFITYTMLIIFSFLMLTMFSVMLPRAAVAAGRINEVLETKVAVTNKENAKIIDKKDVKGVVKFDNVSFRYPDADADTLTDISFTAEPGKTTAIIGSTGSGKSSLVNLILRFYDITGGNLLVDDIDVSDYNLSSLRAAIGYVPQKGVLFSGDIESNILYGAPDAEEGTVEEAARIAQAVEFITEKPEGYASPIAQGGTNVSGGQRQRLSIARAIARDPKIYIFDDSFSALDYKTDGVLRAALAPKVKDATVIIVAQRINTILHADQIVVLDEGKMVGLGSHKELMESCEVYKQIASSQLSEAELAASIQ